MSPTIALIMCVLFVLYLFKIDIREKSEVSSSIWIPLLWFLILASKPIGQWFQAGSMSTSPEDVMTGSPLDRNILTILMLLGIIVLFKRKINWSKVLRNNSWVFIFFFYCGISILWSDFIGIAFKRYLRGVGTIVMILVVLTEQNPFEAIKTVLRRSAYVLIPVSILLIKYFRDLGVSYSPWGEGYMNTGVATHKNGLGRICMVCGFYYFAQIAEIWRNRSKLFVKKQFMVDIVLLSMIIWLLIKAGSATSLVGLFVGIVIFTWLGVPFIKRNIKYIEIIFIFILIVAVILQLSFNVLEVTVGGLGRNMTFTDRVFLWKDVIALTDNPLIGTGYDSFWLGDRLYKLWDKYWWQPNEAHNGYIELYIELGLIGIFIFMGIIVQTYRRIRRILISEFDYGRFQMAFFIMYFLYNITEAQMKLRTMMFFIFLLTTFYYQQASTTALSGGNSISGSTVPVDRKRPRYL